MSEYSIFKPKSNRGIFSDYPELRKYPEFSGIKADQMLFVWYYACEASPFYDIENNRERIEKSIEAAFMKDGRKLISDDKKEDLLDGKFPAKLSVAIDAMRKFRIGPRVRAKILTEKIFNNIESILSIDASKKENFLNKDGEVDFSKKKAYMDAASKASEMMPKLINQLENNFSVSEEKGASTATFEGESLIDDYHENQD